MWGFFVWVFFVVFTLDLNFKLLGFFLPPLAALTVYEQDYAAAMAALAACFLMVSMKGTMHLSDPMKRYVTTLDSHGNNLKENMCSGA